MTETPKSCFKATGVKVEGLFERWSESLQSGAPKKATANYTADAVLLPILSNMTGANDVERKDYFYDFLKKQTRRNNRWSKGIYFMQTSYRRWHLY